MRFRFTGRQAVGLAGCALFCLFVCVMAFLNRTLILEPATEFLRGAGFAEAKSDIQQNLLSDRLRGKDELLTLNGGYARLQGRLRYNQTLRMTNGMLTDIHPELTDTSEFSDNLDRFSRFLEKRGIPFLFIMAPYKIPSEEDLLPAGITDRTNAIADQALTELRKRNVPVLDLREEMSRTRAQVEKYFYRTDHHWNAEGAFYAYQRIMEAIRAQFPETGTSFTDQAMWEKNVIPDWWLGSYGRRVGPLFGGVDDLDYYLPAFGTDMGRYSLGIWVLKGDFRKACIEEWSLERSDYLRMDSYYRYLGGGYPLTLHRNARAENNRKLLLLRDSYMLPVECFLSTEITSVDVLDPREYGIMSETDYVTLNPPDMVIMMINPGVFPSSYYHFYTDFGEESELTVTGETAWDEITVSGASGNSEYQKLPTGLESGKSYQLTLDHIRVISGDPDGANLALYDGDELVDQVVFHIDYGNQFGFHWGFRIPEDVKNEGELQLRLYAGVSGGTEGMELAYQGIRLKECVLAKP